MAKPPAFLKKADKIASKAEKGCGECGKPSCPECGKGGKGKKPNPFVKKAPVGPIKRSNKFAAKDQLEAFGG